MAVAVTFGHSWASGVFYNFSAMKLIDDENLDWEGTLVDYRKALSERDKRAIVVMFDIADDTVSLIKKGKVERLQPLSDVVACALDPSQTDPRRGHTIIITFKPPAGKKPKKFEETVRIELCNRFDVEIIRELVSHSNAHDGSIKDLEDSFPKQTLHHSALGIRSKSSYDTKYCVLVKWKLYIYDDWYSKNTSSSLSVMGVVVEKDLDDKKKLELKTYPTITYLKAASEEERDFWYIMLYQAASLDMPGMAAEPKETGMDWTIFERLIARIHADDPELTSLDFTTDSTMMDHTDWHLNEEQAIMLAEALMTPNTIISKTDLSTNTELGWDGLTAISECLLDNLPSTANLGLSACRLADDGCYAICEHLF